MSRKIVFVLMVAALALLWLFSPSDASREAGPMEAVEALHEPGVLVVDFVDGTSAMEVEAFESTLGLDLVLSSDVSEDEALYRAEVGDLAAAVARVSGVVGVEAVEPVIQLEASAYPNDPDYDKQWNMRMIGQPFAWRGSRGHGVRVAVLDTGITVVEDLEGVDVEAGRTFIKGTSTAADDHGHGTHVAGTIAQATHNGVGVTGIAPEATLVPYKVLSARGFGTSDGIAAAIDAAADDGVDIINMSLGGRYSKVVDIAVRKAVARGVVVVAAAGNSGRKGIGCPACLRPVIAVSAVGPNDQITRYSSWGPGVEVAAPGGDLRVKDGGILQDTVAGPGKHAYRALQGTSMASPHVAGAVAVLMGMGLDGQAAVDTLLSTAKTSTPGVVSEKYGHGRLDLKAAVSSVLIRQRGSRFAIAGAVLLLLTMMARLPLGVVASATAASAMTAGGLFFLPWLPVGPNGATEILSRGLIEWPAAMGMPGWMGFPVWASALIPLALAFVLGWSRFLGGIVAGIAGGYGFSLIYTALAQSVDVWALSSTLEQGWLVANGGVCILISLAVLGVQRMRRSEA